jgi:serine/threonine-protein kinase
MKEPPVKQGDVLAEKYLVESVLGVGGMGVVVEALHLELHESRAIKLLLPEVLEEKEAVERFLREARRSARLRSEHVVRVHDVDKLPSGAPYVVMELLQGSDLRKIIKERGRLPVGEAVHYALQACEALAEAHAAGIVHRDLKPANLFLTTRNDGTPCVKVLDFGISKGPNDGDDELTKTQAVLGSPSYMSPEQMRSARTVDARTDIWSLGVILYRLTTGELPFRAETMAALVTKVLQTTPRRPSEIVPDLPPGLDEVLLRCLERELPVRYADVGALSAALLPFAPPEARASIERIGRVLAIASHGGGVLPSIPLPTPSDPGRTADPSTQGAPQKPREPFATPATTRGSGTSGDAWANTSFGGGTIAVTRWKLWALVSASAALALALGVSLLVSARVGHVGGDHPAAEPAAAVTPTPGSAGAVNPPTPVAPSPVAAGAPPGPSTAVAVAVVPAHPETPKPASLPGFATVKGPLPGTRPAVAKAAKTADPAPSPAPVAPAPPPTAPHRVFGSEN